MGTLLLDTRKMPLRFVSANIAGPSSAGGLNVTTGATTRRICRVYFSIGSGDISQLVLSWFAFYINASVGITACNGYTVEAVSIEQGGTSTNVTFSGGRAKVIATGASDIQPDPLTIALTRGSSGYLRFMLTFANPTTDISPLNGFQANPGGDHCAFDYDPAKVIITNGVDATGPLAYTMTGGGVDGVDIRNNAFPMVPAILGKFASGDPATWLIPGDSAGFGTGAQTGSSEGARGLSWAFYPGSAVPSSPAGAIANWNLCCNSGKATDWAGGTPSLLAAYFKYFTYGLDEYGGNDANIPASQAIWASLYAAGIKYIIKTSLIPRNNGPVCAIAISSLTSSGTTATATVASTANLTSGQTYPISGATPAAYNGSYVITVTSATTFTYTFAGGTSPATGTIIADDQFRTEAFQTIAPGWGPGSAADTFEQGLKALVSPTLAYIDHTAIRGSNHWVFAVNGTPDLSTNDGQHPSTQGYLDKCYGAAAVTTALSGTVTSSLQALINSLP